MPEKIDEDPNISDGLSSQEYEELKNLLSTGFPTWEKKEYEAFLNALDFIPKDDIEKIANEIPTKTFEEVKNYCQSFWSRIDEFSDGQRIIKNIEKKEKLEKQKQQSSMLIAKKCQNIGEGEYEEIKIAFPTNNHQSEYSYEEDQYLIYITHKYGYGNWDEIMKKIKTSEDLLFNYFLKSRNKIEIQKRIDYLVKIIEKEYNPNTNNEKTNLRKNRENKEKNEEDISIMMSNNISKISSSNKKLKKIGKDKINENNEKFFEDSSNKKLGNNINLDEDEEDIEKKENDDNNNNNSSYKKAKIEESENNILNMNDSNSKYKEKNEVNENMDIE